MTDDVTLSVRVQPNARTEAATCMADGTVKISLRAPAVDGKANDALIHFLSDTLAIKKSAIFLVTGETSRCKRIRIQTQNKEKIVKWLASLMVKK